MNTPRFVRCIFPLIVSILAFNAVGGTPASDMATAANEFLGALSPELKAKASYEFKHDERVNWHFVPRARNGVPFKELSPEQQLLGRTLLRSGLSSQGYTKATNIMLTVEQVLRDLENGAARRDPGLYFITIFGDPNKSPWGWRVEGHHLAVNFTIDAGEVISVTPTFMGSNPAEVAQGPHKGLRVLAREDDLGRELVMSLNPEQKATAVFATNAPRDIITGNSRTAKPLEPAGIAAAKLTAPQRELLLSLIKEYVFRYRPEIAEKDLKKIQDAGFDKVHFAWAGGFEQGQGNYYRVQGPTFLMEFDNTQNRANHIHTVWRDFANDFGDDLLRRHYENAPHGHQH